MGYKGKLLGLISLAVQVVPSTITDHLFLNLLWGKNEISTSSCIVIIGHSFIGPVVWNGINR